MRLLFMSKVADSIYWRYRTSESYRSLFNNKVRDTANNINDCVTKERLTFFPPSAPRCTGHSDSFRKVYRLNTLILEG